MTQGLLEAVSGAIGEADNAIGGLVQTRLTAAVQPTTALVAVFTWNGTLTVTTADTSEVEAGDWISLDVDGQQFEVESVVLNTSVTLVNPLGLPIPTGATPSSKATRSLPVESVIDWDDTGKVGIDGTVYRYASRTDTSLDEITHIRGGVTVVGVKRVHSEASPVIDLNRSRSAIDLARRAMLVAYAEGENLNALGRNLGVNRLPFLASDDQFRNIVQALAYNPKGTLFGLELALDALIGEGNYEIYEDLINYPCTVFIRLLGAAALDSISEGKTYLTGPEYQPATGDQALSIDEDVVSRGAVGGVRWKDESVFTDSRTAYPSADVITEYDGDAGNPAWFLSGTGVSEGTHITITGGATEFTLAPPTDASAYVRKLRMDPTSKALWGALITIPTGAPVDTSMSTGFFMDDNEQMCLVGVYADTAGTFQVGIVSGGAFVNGGVSFPRDDYVELTLQKNGRSEWKLFADGVLIDQVAYTGSFPSFGTPNLTFGHYSPAASPNQLRVRQVGVWVQTLTDFWSARGSSGAVQTANPTQFSAGVVVFQTTDVGKQVAVRNSGVTNGQNGNNNGRFIIDSYVSSSIVELRGSVEEGAIVQGAFPLRIEVPLAGKLFQFPDDLGKEIVLSGSTLGNDATCTIDKLLDPVTLVDFESWATPVPEKTNVCEVIITSGPVGFTTETGLTWQMNPVFVNETLLDWELSDAGSVTGTTLSLRQDLPLTASECHRVLEVMYSNVLSAQLLLNALVGNQVIQELPDLLFAYYPFYIADPLGFVRIYLDDITAAGVIPDFLIE